MARIARLGGFFGRFSEAEVLSRLKPGAPMTLVGPPGIGKTRLAWELAHGWHGEPVVMLAETTDANTVLGALASALNLSLEGAATKNDLVERVHRSLSRRNDLLLVLDNVEQLPDDATAFVCELARDVSHACVVLTSQRELPGFVSLHLEGLKTSDSVALFVDRSQRVAGHIDDERVVADLVDLLEGVPLAIELAASRTAVLTPTQILKRLRDSSEILSTAPPTTPRHRSLEAAIAWAFRLLSANERGVMLAVSAFRGGFDLPAAEAILAPLTSQPILDVLQSLRQRSLLRTHISLARGDEVRFDLYRSIRTPARVPSATLVTRCESASRLSLKAGIPTVDSASLS